MVRFDSLDVNIIAYKNSFQELMNARIAELAMAGLLTGSMT